MSLVTGTLSEVGIPIQEQRRRSGLTKLKGIAIPENDSPCAGTSSGKVLLSLPHQ